MKTILGQLATIIIFFVILTGQSAAVFAQSSTAVGTKIINVAKASYAGDGGDFFETVSPTVEIIVAAVAAFGVTPVEAQGSNTVAANDTLNKNFQVCNTGNVAATYTLTSATVSAPSQIGALYYDIDGDGEVSAGDLPITFNSTQSPQLDSGQCIGITVVVETRNINYGEKLNLSINVRSNTPYAVNGAIEKSASVSSSVGKPAVFTDPNDPTLIPSKLVENKSSYISAKGEALNYVISFKNNGEVPARNVVVTDELPAELAYIKNTLRVGTRAVSDAEDADEGFVKDRLLTVKLSNQVAPGEIVQISFKAAVTNETVAGRGIVNTAKINAANAQTAETSQAIAVVDPFGTVYAARGGASSPIAGAKVVIATEQTGENALNIPADNGFTPNFENTNPYLTNSQGRYSFGLRPDQLGSASQPAVYYVIVTAENYRPRLMQISLSPTQSGLFKMIVRSLDKMPLAAAGGFELVQDDVELSSIADIAFNIPMFENATLTVTKTADRAQAEIGDILNYRIELKNSSVAPVYETVVIDTLPLSFNYAANTAQITRAGSTTAIEPEVSNGVLKFHVGEIRSGENFSITYRVRVGVNARNGDNYNSARASGNFASGETVATSTARAGVKIGGGLFSMRQFIIGRVFIDENGNQFFDDGEKPVVGARIYLATGEAVITDSKGMYNLPAVGEGAQVVGLDPITLPQGYVLADNNSLSGKSWTRLLRTPLGGGIMLRQNFVLTASKINPPVGNIESEDENAEATPKTEDEKTKSLSTANILAEMQESQIVAAEYTDETAPAKNENFRPLAAGEILIHSLEENQVVMTPAFDPEISVALGWKAKVFLNGQEVDQNNIGTTREDRKNGIATYTFVGLGLKPGPNMLKVTAYKDDAAGNTATVTVYGRGSSKRLEISGDKSEIEASGRDSARITIKAYDEWNHPAQDSTVMVSTTAGSLVKADEYADKRKAARDNKIVISQGLTKTGGIASEQVSEAGRDRQIEIRNGVGVVKLLSEAKIETAHLKAVAGEAEAETDVRFVSEIRPQMLVALAELTVGKNAPEMQNRNVDEDVRGHVQLFYRGRVFGTKNMVTLAYDSQQPLNRVAGRDRMFQLNPLDRVYPMFGDSSTRFQETESNSKVYARIDRGRSYAMFGDFTADMDSSRLLSYSRKLTGAKVRIENSNGDFVTVTGARPDTSFARQIIPGGSLSFVRLAYGDIMPGSEVLTIETRDRRNPEIIVSSEMLTRGLDYNIDTSTGTIFFLRPVQTFDRLLNLTQVVATYEYRSNGFESSVYTARGSKKIEKLNNLRVGFSYVDQRQSDASPFRLGGVDMSIDLPNKGRLSAEWAMSKGTLNTGFNFFGNTPSGANGYNGNAFFLQIEQPVPFRQSILRFEGSTSSKNFFNPFGSTVTPGSTRGAFSWEMKPTNKGTLKVNLTEEINKTDNVDNSRLTAGIHWTQAASDKLRFDVGYDFRHFTDNDSGRTVTSNLLTFGAQYKPTERLSFAVKREQNLGEADPTYPNQTLISADYRVSEQAKIFFTQRFGAAAITPIADVSNTGFAASQSRNETALGVETAFGKYTSLSGSYRLENGINGTDSFAVVGLQNRLPVSKKLSFDLGYEHAFHLAGEGKSYNNFLFGANYLPSDSFRSSFRYELRNRDGFGQVFSFGTAGEIKPGWTALGRFQYGNISFNEQKNKITDGQLAFAVRPHNTDKYGLLFAYTHRSSFFTTDKPNVLPTDLKSDILSVDGFHQTTRRLELYGRFALKFSGDGNTSLPYANNLTLLTQARAQYKISRFFDIAAENRFLYQPSSGSQKNWFGTELGFWATPDLRFGGGYNFSRSQEPSGFNTNNAFNKNGFYFVISTKVSRIFNLFGTEKEGLEYQDNKSGLKPVSEN